jgi:hypothetical protein
MHDELLLDPVTDKNGTTLTDEDVIDSVERPEKVLFIHDGIHYMVWVRKSQLTTKTWNRISSAQAKIAFKAGFKPGEDTSNLEMGDDRMLRMLELMNESVSLEEARAAAALEATAIDENGQLLTNVPQIRNLVNTPQDLVELGRLGEAFTKAVNDYLNPTSTPGEAEATKTNPASDTESSGPLSSMNQENYPATG